MKRLFSLFLGVMLVLSLCVPSVFADREIVGFTDVPESHWAHDAIMYMTYMGYLKGITPPDESGYSKFNPNGSMTRAQFITVISRILGYTEGYYEKEILANNYWYMGSVYYCMELGVLNEFNDLSDLSQMNQPITREEMAYLISNTAHVEYEDLSVSIDTSDIPDYFDINANYLNSVLECYSNGILVGVDNEGTFNPKGVLNRAQASVVIYRLLEESARIKSEGKEKVVDSLNYSVKVEEYDGHSPFIGSRRDLDIYNAKNGYYYSVYPTKLVETKDFTYNNKHYVADEGNYYLILYLYGINRTIPVIDFSDYYFRITTSPFKSDEIYSEESSLHYFDKMKVSEGAKFNGFVVFEVPLTVDFSKDGEVGFSVCHDYLDEYGPHTWSTGGLMKLEFN